MQSGYLLLLTLATLTLGEAGILKRSKNARLKSGLRNEVEINNETFYIADDGYYLTWYEAEIKCNELSMQLVTFDSVERWETISMWLRQNPEYDKWMWSSGHKAVGEDQFKWTTTGENFNNTNWNLGQPDIEPEYDACMNFYAAFGGWDDDSCTGFSLMYMCEFP